MRLKDPDQSDANDQSDQEAVHSHPEWTFSKHEVYFWVGAAPAITMAARDGWMYLRATSFTCARVTDR